MKFVLFCEGATEHGALPDFLRRWLQLSEHQLPEKVGVQPVRFKGWAELVKESPKKAKLHLAIPDVIAVVALLDLYGAKFCSHNHKTNDERIACAKAELEQKVDHPDFMQHFAVHDIEAWILSDPEVLPAEVRKKLPPKCANPETVNFNEPPSDLLNRLYEEGTKRGYKKVTYGEELFRKLDPQVVRKKCPYFRLLADELVERARKALEKGS